MCLVCCGVLCDFALRAMFGLSLPSVVCGRVRVLFVCLRMVVGGVCCVVFLFFFVLCVPYVARFSGLSILYCSFGIL